MAFAQLILLVFAFVLFALAALGATSTRFSLTDAGLACWVLSMLLGAGGALMK